MIAKDTGSMKSLPWSVRIDNAATNPRKTSKPVVSMSALDAIYHRRAMRNYLPSTIGRAVIQSLFDAAVHAPTAMFVVADCWLAAENREAP
jgi:3-methyladenine DNA glycosylase AlkC